MSLGLAGLMDKSRWVNVSNVIGKSLIVNTLVVLRLLAKLINVDEQFEHGKSIRISVLN